MQFLLYFFLPLTCFSKRQFLSAFRYFFGIYLSLNNVLKWLVLDISILDTCFLSFYREGKDLDFYLTFLWLFLDPPTKHTLPSPPHLLTCNVTISIFVNSIFAIYMIICMKILFTDEPNNDLCYISFIVHFPLLLKIISFFLLLDFVYLILIQAPNSHTRLQNSQ
jgi:hypothetical protein